MNRLLQFVLIVGLLGCALPSWATTCSSTSFSNGWTCGQSGNTSNTGAGASAAVTLGANITAGHMVIMYGLACSNSSCGTSVAGYSITPTVCGGDTITASPGSPFTITNHLMYVWVVASAVGGCKNCSVAVTGATPFFTTSECSEWTGGATASVFDKDASSSGSGTSATVTTASTTNATDLVYGVINAASSAPAKGTGFTEIDVNSTNAFEWEGKSVTSTGAQSCTWTMSSEAWQGVCVAIKAASTAKNCTMKLMGRARADPYFNSILEAFMTTQTIGEYVQLGGAGAFIVGTVLSLHHYAIEICFIAGVAAFYVGQKMRAA